MELYPRLSWGFHEQAEKKRKKKEEKRRKKEERKGKKRKSEFLLQTHIDSENPQFLKAKTMNSYESPREKRNHFGVILRAA